MVQWRSRSSSGDLTLNILGCGHNYYSLKSFTPIKSNCQKLPFTVNPLSSLFCNTVAVSGIRNLPHGALTTVIRYGNINTLAEETMIDEKATLSS